MAPVSIHDVAAAAGVSRNTVSLALRGSARVRPETCLLVRQAAERLNYRPNRVAQAMVTGKSHVLGLVIPRLDFSYMPALVEAIHELAFERGYSVLFTGHEDRSEKLVESVEFLLDHRVESLLVYHPTQPLSRQTLECIKRVTVPTVFISFNNSNLPGVTFDICPEEAGAMAIQRVVAEGHRQIVYLGPQRGLFEQARLRGVRRAAAALKLPPLQWWPTPHSLEGGREAAQRYFATSQRPTALVCFADPIAVGVLQDFSRLGIRVPHEVSVVGVDDLPMAEGAAVPLTTLRAPAAELGRSAVEELLQRSVTTSKRVRRRKQFHWRWIDRASLAPPLAAHE